MSIKGIIWLEEVLAKIQKKHRVSPEEVEQVLRSKPHFRFVEKGYRRGEHVYVALGRAASGRRLSVFFVRKLTADALIISARDMDPKERRWYEKAKGRTDAG